MGVSFEGLCKGGWTGYAGEIVVEQVQPMLSTIDLEV